MYSSALWYYLGSDSVGEPGDKHPEEQCSAGSSKYKTGLIYMLWCMHVSSHTHTHMEHTIRSFLGRDFDECVCLLVPNIRTE